MDIGRFLYLILSKVFESLISEQLSYFLTKHNILLHQAVGQIIQIQ